MMGRAQDAEGSGPPPHPRRHGRERPGPSLLQSLHHLIERTYRMDTGIKDVGRYVIGDEGYRLLYPELFTQVRSAADRDLTTGGLVTRVESVPARVSSRPASCGARAVPTASVAAPAAGAADAPERVAGGLGWETSGLEVLDVRDASRHEPDSVAGRAQGNAARSLHSVGSGSETGAEARVLVRDGPRDLHASLYYPDALIRSLEEHPPGLGLGERNIDPFSTFVEELDHLLLIAERARLKRPVSLLELEMHAHVTKYLVCALFLAAGRRRESRYGLEPQDRIWLIWHLFEKIEYAEPDPPIQARYKDARRFARRFLLRLDAEPSAAARLVRLRSFHDSMPYDKLAALA